MIYQFGRFTLNSDARALLADQAEVHLSPKAFTLLLMLIEHRQRVMTKQELQDMYKFIMSDLVDCWKDTAPFTYARKSGWAENPAVREEWLAAGGQGNIESWLALALQEGLDVSPSRESNLRSPSRGRRWGNAPAIGWPAWLSDMMPRSSRPGCPSWAPASNR